MLTQHLLPDGNNLVVDRVIFAEAKIMIEIISSQTTAICPDCQQKSVRVHSRYDWTIADLAWADQQLELHWHARRFFCDFGRCPRKTFMERRPALVVAYARRTNRLAEQQRKVGWLVGGTVGVRLLHCLKMPTSRNTLLRLIRTITPAQPPCPRIVGVDEWSFHKGHRYGTILVDLERQQVIELLPERNAESLAQWLKAHPEVEMVSRDRASVYRDGIDLGAPKAIQIADRWHLLKNLKEAVQRLMERNRTCLQAATAPISSPEEQAVEKRATSSHPSATIQEQSSQAAHQRRLERYQMVINLHRLGQGVRAISRATGLAPKTVRKYLDAGSFPEGGTPTRYKLILAPYLPYLKQHWAKGQHNACQLFREIKAQGYPGSRDTLRRWATKMRKTVATPSAADKLAQKAKATYSRPCSAQYATWLLLTNPPDLSSDKKGALERILQTSPDVTQSYHFTQAFLRIIRQRLSKALDPWLEAVLTYRVPGLVHFARGLKKDLVAVRAALTLPYSNGQLEGQINRLKLIKRQMYGRANFDLLRLRVLSPSFHQLWP